MNDIKIKLLGDKTIRQCMKTAWYSRFLSLDNDDQLPWLDGVLEWISRDSTKTDQWNELTSDQKDDVIMIIAAGHYEKDERIFAFGIAPARLPYGEGTTWESEI